MHLQINENKYVDPNAPKNVKRENAIPRVKLFCLKFLESGPVEAVSMTIISVYSIFVLFMLTYTEIGLKETIKQRTLQIIDSYFLVFFLVEIFLKSFASNMMYLYDAFNMFDAAIVIISMVLN